MSNFFVACVTITALILALRVFVYSFGFTIGVRDPVDADLFRDSDRGDDDEAPMGGAFMLADGVEAVPLLLEVPGSLHDLLLLYRHYIGAVLLETPELNVLLMAVYPSEGLLMDPSMEFEGWYQVFRVRAFRNTVATLIRAQGVPRAPEIVFLNRLGEGAAQGGFRAVEAVPFFGAADLIREVPRQICG
jgi:hypothetical protein